ncbi:hypothetical protein HF319_01380 [Xanthomonas sp. Kuri4-1]
MTQDRKDPNPASPAASAERRDGHAANDSGDSTTDKALEQENAGYNQHGHGKGGKAGEGEPDGAPERDGTTQPNFGQAGTYGADSDAGK